MNNYREIPTTDTEFSVYTPTSKPLWIRYKTQIFGVIVLIVGALGGNVDRLYEFLPNTTVINKDITDLQNRVTALEVKINNQSNDKIRITK